MSNPGVFIHDQKGIQAIAHVDDIMAVASADALEWMRRGLEAHYELKHKVLGTGRGESKVVTFLGRDMALPGKLAANTYRSF